MGKLSGRCGEHLVCAELLREEIIATTFSGHMPHFDILTPRHKIQVKTTTKTGKQDETWSMDAKEYLIFDDELFNNKGKQKIVGKKKLDENIIFVFVLLGNEYGEDRFFILDVTEVQDKIHARYMGHCKEEYEGCKVRTRKSFYANIHLSQIVTYENKWEILKT